MANRKKLKRPARESTTGRPDPEIVAVYYRVSSLGQAERETVERQRFVCARLIDRLVARGARFLGEFVDEAYNLEAFDKNRQIWRLMRLVEAGRVTTVVLAAEDRMFRGESQALRGRILDTLRAGTVRVVTPVSDVEYRSSDAGARLTSSLAQEMGAVNKLELVKQLQSASRLGVERRNFHQPIAPFAIRVDRRIVERKKHFSYRAVPEEAQIVRDIFSLYLGRPTEVLPSHAPKRLGYVAIAKILRKSRVSRQKWIEEAAHQAKPDWTTAAVVKILTCELYTGRRVVNFRASKLLPAKTVTRDVPEVAIISREVFDEVQRLRGQKADTLDRSDSPMARGEDLWFHDFLRCGECNGRMTLRNNYRRGTSNYGCKYSHAMPPLETVQILVSETVTDMRLNPALEERIRDFVAARASSLRGTSTSTTTIEPSAARAELRELRAKLDAIAERYALDEVSDDEYETMTARYRSRIDMLEASLATGTGKKKSDSVALLRPEQYVEKALQSAAEDGQLLRIVFARLGLRLVVSRAARAPHPTYVVRLTEETNIGQ